MYGGVKMRKFYSLLSVISLISLYIFNPTTVRADYEDTEIEDTEDVYDIFVDAGTAEKIIKIYFSDFGKEFKDIVSFTFDINEISYLDKQAKAKAKTEAEKQVAKYDPETMYDEYLDIILLRRVVREYNYMLSEHSCYVSIDGLVATCKAPFTNAILKPGFTKYDLSVKLSNKCWDFVDALINADPSPNPDCPYIIIKYNNKQTHIRYIDKKTQHGFDRVCDSYIPWRFFNPGNVRDSKYKCTILNTEPSGEFAVFQDEETGWKAISWVFKSKNYINLTLRDAIYRYAPPTDKNDTEKYVNDLQKEFKNDPQHRFDAIDVDVTLVSSLNEEEFDMLVKTVAKLEGWFNGINSKNCKIVEF